MVTKTLYSDESERLRGTDRQIWQNLRMNMDGYVNTDEYGWIRMNTDEYG